MLVHVLYPSSFFRIEVNTAAGFLLSGPEDSSAKSRTLRKITYSSNLSVSHPVARYWLIRLKLVRSDWFFGGMTILNARSKASCLSERELASVRLILFFLSSC